MDTTGTSRNPLDGLAPDPTGLPPLCNESDFDDLLEQLVADCAPRPSQWFRSTAGEWTAGSRHGAWRSRTT